MKKTFKTLFLSILAIAGFASCEKEQEGGNGGSAANGLTIIAVTDGTVVPSWSAGDKIKVALDMSRVHLFDKDTERCISH